MAPSLSTTSYAVLGLLALRPLTPYELTQQMQRSLDYCWPTSERSLYDQPERLVAAGLATPITDENGGAPRRRYAITPAGRQALREWLATDSAMPRFQNEPLLRVLLADQATVEDLHRVVGALRAHVAQRRLLGLEQMAPYLQGEGLFQERAHIVTLAADLVSRLLGVLDDWATDVEAITRDWSTTERLGLTDDIREVLEQMLTREQDRATHQRRPQP